MWDLTRFEKSLPHRQQSPSSAEIAAFHAQLTEFMSSAPPRYRSYGEELKNNWPLPAASNNDYCAACGPYGCLCSEGYGSAMSSSVGYGSTLSSSVGYGSARSSDGYWSGVDDGKKAAVTPKLGTSASVAVKKPEFADYASITCLDADSFAELAKHFTLGTCLRTDVVSKGWRNYLPFDQSVTSYNFADICGHHWSPINCDDYAQHIRCLLNRIGEDLVEFSFHTRVDLGDIVDETHFVIPSTDWSHLQLRDWSGTDLIEEMHWEISLEVIYAISARTPNLKCLKIFAADIAPAALKAFGCFRELEILELTNCMIHDERPSNNIVLAPWMKADAGYKSKNIFAQFLFDALRSLKHLKVLRVNEVRHHFGNACVPSTSSFINAISSRSMRVLDIRVGSVDLLALHWFVMKQPHLVELAVEATSHKDAAMPDASRLSIIRALVTHCPELKHLALVGVRYIDLLSDLPLLHDLESLKLSDTVPYDRPGLRWNDDLVVQICHRNPLLTKFILEPYSGISKRVYLDGFAHLRCLQYVHISCRVQLDDSSFETLIKGVSTTLKRIRMDEQSYLTLPSLVTLGSLCEQLEVVEMFVIWEAREFVVCSPDAFAAFANARVGHAGKKVSVVLYGFDPARFRRPPAVEATGLVQVRARGVFGYEEVEY